MAAGSVRSRAAMTQMRTIYARRGNFEKSGLRLAL